MCLHAVQIWSFDLHIFKYKLIWCNILIKWLIKKNAFSLFKILCHKSLHHESKYAMSPGKNKIPQTSSYIFLWSVTNSLCVDIHIKIILAVFSLFFILPGEFTTLVSNIAITILWILHIKNKQNPAL